MVGRGEELRLLDEVVTVEEWGPACKVACTLENSMVQVKKTCMSHFSLCWGGSILIVAQNRKFCISSRTCGLLLLYLLLHWKVKPHCNFGQQRHLFVLFKSYVLYLPKSQYLFLGFWKTLILVVTLWPFLLLCLLSLVFACSYELSPQKDQLFCIQLKKINAVIYFFSDILFPYCSHSKAEGFRTRCMCFILFPSPQIFHQLLRALLRFPFLARIYTKRVWNGSFWSISCHLRSLCLPPEYFQVTVPFGTLFSIRNVLLRTLQCWSSEVNKCNWSF